MKKEMKSNKKSMIKNMIIGIAIFIIYLVFGIAAFPSENTSKDFNFLYYITCMAFTLSIIIFNYKNELKEELKKFNKSFLKNILKCISYCFLLFLIVIISNFIIDNMFGWTKLNSDTLIFPNMAQMFLYTAAVLVIYTPVVEGIIFTKVFKKIINVKILWNVLSGVLFGLMQAGFNFSSPVALISCIPYVLTGTTITMIYDNKKNVFYPIFIWMFYYVLQLIIQSSIYWI